MSMKSNRFWVYLLGSVALISLCAYLLLSLPSPAYANIYQENEILFSYNLNNQLRPYSFTIMYGDGFNIISIEKGRIQVSKANCPDGICVAMGWLDSGTTPIVCLPHRLVIRLENVNPEGIDGITG